MKDFEPQFFSSAKIKRIVAHIAYLASFFNCLTINETFVKIENTTSYENIVFDFEPFLLSFFY